VAVGGIVKGVFNTNVLTFDGGGQGKGPLGVGIVI